METRKGPNNQDEAKHVLALSDHLFFEGTKATCHSPCIAGDVAATSSPA